MALVDQLAELTSRISTLKENIQTEEATKSAFILPFIQALGYDIFNPLEVVPEFIADQSTKKGEKVDYCIMKDGSPIIIIECKHWRDKLDLHNTQLERYFAFTNAKFGILSNGIDYWFYTDLDQTNRMDLKPFLKVHMENPSDRSINELKNFQKENFDADAIFDNASELRYMNEVRSLFDSEIENPSPGFTRHFAEQVYNGRLTSKVLDQFQRIVKRAVNNKINETIKERLTSAIDSETKKQEQTSAETDKSLSPSQQVVFEDTERGIVTTQEEIDAYNIVIDILKETIDPSRIAHRDTKSYMGVLLDDNNRQPICRLLLGGNKKYIGIIDKNKNEQRHQIEKIEHIYMFAKELIATTKMYE